MTDRPADISCMVATRDACLREKANEQIDWTEQLIGTGICTALLALADWIGWI